MWVLRSADPSLIVVELISMTGPSLRTSRAMPPGALVIIAESRGQTASSALGSELPGQLRLPDQQCGGYQYPCRQQGVGANPHGRYVRPLLIADSSPHDGLGREPDRTLLGKSVMVARSATRRWRPTRPNSIRATLVGRINACLDKQFVVAERAAHATASISLASESPVSLHAPHAGELSRYVIEIRRGCASFTFGSVSVSTPSSSCALMPA